MDTIVGEEPEPLSLVSIVVVGKVNVVECTARATHYLHHPTNTWPHSPLSRTRTRQLSVKLHVACDTNTNITHTHTPSRTPIPRCSPAHISMPYHIVRLSYDYGCDIWLGLAAGIFLSVLIFLSVAGNILVCLAIYTERSLRRIGNLFLASLAIADLFVASLVMTFAGVNDLLGELRIPNAMR